MNKTQNATAPKLTEHERGRLERALAGDFRAHPTAYPVLARHGFMERTANGFRSIDGEAVINRCRELLSR